MVSVIGALVLIATGIGIAEAYSARQRAVIRALRGRDHRPMEQAFPSLMGRGSAPAGAAEGLSGRPLGTFGGPADGLERSRAALPVRDVRANESRHPYPTPAAGMPGRADNVIPYEVWVKLRRDKQTAAVRQAGTWRVG